MSSFLFPVLIAVAVLALVAAGVWAYQRYNSTSSGRDDRYTPERILTPEQVSMLDYLHDTFPGQVVLPQVQLKNMLSIRRASDRKRAHKRMEQLVDFVVCGEDGRPVFAFDIEQFHLSNAKAKSLQARLKNRVLKTAGVRFLYLKNGIHRMPSPDEFRKQLDLAVLPQPSPRASTAAEERVNESVRQQLESKFSEFDQLTPPTGFRESEVMGFSGLMGLSEEEEAERMSRQRPPTARARA
ncbi:DUF2726 domain-containing protein [Hydrogenophaga sp. PAMC20947]|uniref:DUF2726 domain-containing protein n=1 Tax=Hydrogenophaga sp. PAMC20947 TaxID=2565558 RepID=UPI00109DB990|nr:DUF2726 domain-containing protein [Hydrogenophaga sp. PAMC20947]QCB46963.1 DUF2726 domain-containing protein [Hydrogenophaga sp. PAMC20947]